MDQTEEEIRLQFIKVHVRQLIAKGVFSGKELNEAVVVAEKLWEKQKQEQEQQTADWTVPDIEPEIPSNDAPIPEEMLRAWRDTWPPPSQNQEGWENGYEEKPRLIQGQEEGLGLQQLCPQEIFYSLESERKIDKETLQNIDLTTVEINVTKRGGLWYTNEHQILYALKTSKVPIITVKVLPWAKLHSFGTRPSPWFDSMPEEQSDKYLDAISAFNKKLLGWYPTKTTDTVLPSVPRSFGSPSHFPKVFLPLITQETCVTIKGNSEKRGGFTENRDRFPKPKTSYLVKNIRRGKHVKLQLHPGERVLIQQNDYVSVTFRGNEAFGIVTVSNPGGHVIKIASHYSKLFSGTVDSVAVGAVASLIPSQRVFAAASCPKQFCIPLWGETPVTQDDRREFTLDFLMALAPSFIGTTTLGPKRELFMLCDNVGVSPEYISKERGGEWVSRACILGTTFLQGKARFRGEAEQQAAKRAMWQLQDKVFPLKSSGQQIWEWQDVDTEDWIPYDEEISDFIEDELTLQKKRTAIPGHEHLKLDLVNFIQINSRTRQERYFHRSLPDPEAQKRRHRRFVRRFLEEQEKLANHPPMNDPQRKAVLRILDQNELVTLIQGPPGTGKTTTIVCALNCLFEQQSRVLITAPSNDAVNVVVTSFLAQRETQDLSRVVLVGAETSVDLSGILDEVFLDSKIRRFRDLLKSLMELTAYALAYGERNSSMQRLLEKCVEQQKRIHLPAILDQRWQRIYDSIVMVLRRALCDQSPEGTFFIGQDERTILTRCQEHMKPAFANEDKFRMSIEQVIVKGSQFVFSTLCSAGRSVIRNHGGRFKFGIIDEAAQASEPEAMIPLLCRIDKMVLVGDPKQLGPTVVCPEAERAKFKQSLMERLMALKYHTTLLAVQYRMAPEIVAWPSKYFYRDNLLSADNVKEYDSGLAPVVFFDVHGQETTRGESFDNMEEARCVAEVVRELVIDMKVNPSSIGILSFYSGQVRTLKQEIGQRWMQRGLRIQTVDGFQGQERDIMILSFVRCNNEGVMGFVDREQRLNVALTRAKHQLILIGNRDTMLINRGRGNMFRHLLKDIEYCTYEYYRETTIRPIIITDPKKLQASSLTLKESEQSKNQLKVLDAWKADDDVPAVSPSPSVSRQSASESARDEDSLSVSSSTTKRSSSRSEVSLSMERASKTERSSAERFVAERKAAEEKDAERAKPSPTFEELLAAEKVEAQKAKAERAAEMKLKAEKAAALKAAWFSAPPSTESEKQRLIRQQREEFQERERREQEELRRSKAERKKEEEEANLLYAQQLAQRKSPVPINDSQEASNVIVIKPEKQRRMPSSSNQSSGSENRFIAVVDADGSKTSGSLDTSSRRRQPKSKSGGESLDSSELITKESSLDLSSTNESLLGPEPLEPEQEPLPEPELEPEPLPEVLAPLERDEDGFFIVAKLTGPGEEDARAESERERIERETRKRDEEISFWALPADTAMGQRQSQLEVEKRLRQERFQREQQIESDEKSRKEKSRNNKESNPEEYQRMKQLKREQEQLEYERILAAKNKRREESERARNIEKRMEVSNAEKRKEVAAERAAEREAAGALGGSEKRNGEKRREDSARLRNEAAAMAAVEAAAAAVVGEVQGEKAQARSKKIMELEKMKMQLEAELEAERKALEKEKSKAAMKVRTAMLRKEQEEKEERKKEEKKKKNEYLSSTEESSDKPRISVTTHYLCTPTGSEVVGQSEVDLKIGNGSTGSHGSSNKQ